jgi:serine/threonine-protein kinase
MSCVYKAFMENGAQEVVLKEAVLPHRLDEAERQELITRFQKEARLQAALNHKNIARVLDFFVENGRYYLVIEYVAGKVMRQVIKDVGACAELKAASWGLQIADALIAMHEREPPLIHRDITPDNIIVCSDNDLKIIDFGAANEILDQATGTIVGKQAYMPAEQFRGKATCASDIYALGGTLFFLLTGLDPEPLKESHPSQINSAVSSQMDSLVARCTQVDMESRFASARQVYDELKQIIESHRSSSSGGKHD